MDGRHAGSREERRHQRAVEVVNDVQRGRELVGERENREVAIKRGIEDVEEVEGTDDFHGAPAETAWDVEEGGFQGGFASGVVGEEPLGQCELFYAALLAVESTILGEEGGSSR